MFKADFIQHLDLGSSPTCNSLLTLTEAHFFQSLSDTVLNVLPSLIVTDRNVVDVQVWRGFVHVQDSVKNVKVGVAILETFYCTLLGSQPQAESPQCRNPNLLSCRSAQRPHKSSCVCRRQCGQCCRVLPQRDTRNSFPEPCGRYASVWHYNARWIQQKADRMLRLSADARR